MTGPATAVLTAVRGGARSLPDVVRTTGLSVATAAAVLDQLVRTRWLVRRGASVACPPAGCRGCSIRGLLKDTD